MADRQRQLEEERREKAKELASLKLELEKQAQQMAEFEKRMAHRKSEAEESSGKSKELASLKLELEKQAQQKAEITEHMAQREREAEVNKKAVKEMQREMKRKEEDNKLRRQEQQQRRDEEIDKTNRMWAAQVQELDQQLKAASDSAQSQELNLRECEATAIKDLLEKRRNRIKRNKEVEELTHQQMLAANQKWTENLKHHTVEVKGKGFGVVVGFDRKRFRFGDSEHRIQFGESIESVLLLRRKRLDWNQGLPFRVVSF